VTDRDYRAEVDERYPYDPQSEAKLLRGGFDGLDPNKLRGVKDRAAAAFLWCGLCRIKLDEHSGAAQRRREREAQEREDAEYQALIRLSDDAFSGRAGRDGKALAHKLLVDSDGLKHLDMDRLVALRDGLRALREEARRRQGHG
jgi:hypothetical protein